MPHRKRRSVGGSLTTFPAGPSRMRPGGQTWGEILIPIAVVAGLVVAWWAIKQIPAPKPL